MAKTMNASTGPGQRVMSDGQIEDLTNKLRDAARKRRAEISSDFAQRALGTENLGMVLLAPFLQLVAMFSNLIVRSISGVDRTRKPEQVLAATGREQYVDEGVLKTMTRGTGDSATIILFQPTAEEYTNDLVISSADLEKAFERRGLTPAPADDLAAVNEADPTLADEKPNVTLWPCKGRMCFIAFCRGGSGRRVDVAFGDGGWGVYWWFAGLRK